MILGLSVRENREVYCVCFGLLMGSVDNTFLYTGFVEKRLWPYSITDHCRDLRCANSSCSLMWPLSPEGRFGLQHTQQLPWCSVTQCVCWQHVFCLWVSLYPVGHLSLRTCSISGFINPHCLMPKGFMQPRENIFLVFSIFYLHIVFVLVYLRLLLQI